VTASGCPACQGRWPDEASRIADLGSAVAYLHEDQYFAGWSVLVLKRHATELYDLSPGERAGLGDELARLARALHDGLGARKMNYALLGNVLPHLHWHVIPRLADDPIPDRTVWDHAHAARKPGAAEQASRIALIRRHLDRSGCGAGSAP
jgi:diadenosine tetraphosphate (Ap4A) HIT family hydrolase